MGSNNLMPSDKIDNELTSKQDYVSFLIQILHLLQDFTQLHHSPEYLQELNLFNI